MSELIKRVEFEILKTPTGELRNLLCDINIALQKTSEQDMEKIKTIILPAWEMRRRAAEVNPGGKKVIALQHEFIVGGIAVLDALRNDGESCISPSVYVSIIRGEYIR